MIKFSAHKILQSGSGEMPFDVSFEMQKGQFLTVYGNSGAGKTTLLRILAGLTSADKSMIEVDGMVWDNSDKKFHLPVQKRSVGFVFQDFALFPNMSVGDNLIYALPKGSDTKLADELVELMEIQALKKSKPDQLSGGQKQRVALARAIVRKPHILLLDEPLSAIDDEMRFILQDYILKAHNHFKLTTILISHHLPEIFKLSDYVIRLDKGRIVKEGIPSIVFAEGMISSKFKLTGEIIAIEKSDIIYIVSILAGNSIVKVVATADEAISLKPGIKVLVASKAFNPLIQVISQ